MSKNEHWVLQPHVYRKREHKFQTIEFIEHMKYGKVHLIGSSGGALVAINIALERPDLVGKVIADSFEGEFALKEFTQNIIDDRAASKQDVGAIMSNSEEFRTVAEDFFLELPRNIGGCGIRA